MANPAGKRRSARQSRLNFDQRQNEEVIRHRRAVRSINEATPVKAKTRPRSGLFGAGTQQTIELSSDSDSSAPETRLNGVGEAETSGDEVIVSSPAKKPKRGAARKQTFVVSDDTEDEITVTPKKAKPQIAEKEASDEEDDELPTTQRKRRRPPTTPSRRSKQEKEDLKEDLEFIGSSGGRLKRRQEKTPVKAMQSARQKALELLKRRRAGDKIDSPAPEAASGEGRKRGLYDTDSDSDYGEDGLEEVEDEDEIADPPGRNGRSDTDANDMFTAGDEDDDFIVEDDEDAMLGAPVDLPLQFSTTSRMKSKDLFKYAVEWMVQKKINPAFAIADEIYDLAFRKLDDEVRGLAGSKFTSSAWTPGFTQAYKSRPKIEVTEAPGLYDHCAACNRRGHPATWQIQFKGKPYHKETLEEVSDGEDSEDETEPDGTTYDADGREVPDENVIYNLGRFCKQNAQIAHTLAHWRYHLNDWVVDYLREEGYTSPEKIVERDSWSTKKRQKYANEVADAMERSGEIKRLYRDYRNEIDTARDSRMAGSGRQLELDFD